MCPKLYLENPVSKSVPAVIATAMRIASTSKYEANTPNMNPSHSVNTNKRMKFIGDFLLALSTQAKTMITAIVIPIAT